MVAKIPITMFPTRSRPIIFLADNLIIHFDFINNSMYFWEWTNSKFNAPIHKYRIVRLNEKIYIFPKRYKSQILCLKKDSNAATIQTINRENRVDHSNTCSLIKYCSFSNCSTTNFILLDKLNSYAPQAAYIDWNDSTTIYFEESTLTLREKAYTKDTKNIPFKNRASLFKLSKKFGFLADNTLYIGTITDEMKLHTHEIKLTYHSFLQLFMTDDNILIILAIKLINGTQSDYLIFVDCETIEVAQEIDLGSSQWDRKLTLFDLNSTRTDQLTLLKKYQVQLCPHLLPPLVELIVMYMFNTS
ncbi:MAG: hypothetical protein Harvfovirus25_2 [Harvfovirus sp.]|uniref:Uncharacterized protein n=1 Tax=Harvfovirus sp. TaxID=2487768 RepID=A0A3G5A635_9VIRU|nr:MAG: hypothetical protein Harvfovirus25_2 [Harvfovirus sp.]